MSDPNKIVVKPSFSKQTINASASIRAQAGGSGTSDYTELANKPQINGVVLSGNKTAAELGLVRSVNGQTGDVTVEVATDAQVAEAVDDWLTVQAPSIGTLSYAAKQALLACFRKVAWIDDQGQSYYNSLERELISSVTVDSITAVFTQGSATIFDSDSLDTLRQYLVVTATYSDSTTAAVTDYTLSGDLAYDGGIVDLLDGVSWTDGIAFDDNGNQLNRPTLSCSDFLPVTLGTVYTYSKLAANATQYAMTLYLYDANKTWLGVENSNGTLSGDKYVKTYTPASNVSYVRLMSTVDAKSGAEFTYDATPASWTSTITANYGGKTATFNVTVTQTELLFVGASYGASTTGGTVTFNQDGTVRLVSTGATNWGLCFSPYGSASAFKTWGELKGHAVRLVYKITWAGKNSTTRLSAAGYLCSDLSRYDATRLRYSNFFDTYKEADVSMLENKEGYIDLLIPSEASGWESGSSAVSDSNYFSYRAYLETSASGADVTLDFKFYDMGVMS